MTWRLVPSLLLLAAPVAIYWLVIRPRLQARFVDVYAGVDGLWARLGARLYAFRTWFIGFAGILAAEGPALLEVAAVIDPATMPPWWRTGVLATTVLLTLLNRAFATKPREEAA